MVLGREREELTHPDPTQDEPPKSTFPASFALSYLQTAGIYSKYKGFFAGFFLFVCCCHEKFPFSKEEINFLGGWVVSGVGCIKVLLPLTFLEQSSSGCRIPIPGAMTHLCLPYLGERLAAPRVPFSQGKAKSGPKQIRVISQKQRKITPSPKPPSFSQIHSTPPNPSFLNKISPGNRCFQHSHPRFLGHG